MSLNVIFKNNTSKSRDVTGNVKQLTEVYTNLWISRWKKSPLLVNLELKLVSKFYRILLLLQIYVVKTICDVLQQNREQGAYAYLKIWTLVFCFVGVHHIYLKVLQRATPVLFSQVIYPVVSPGEQIPKNSIKSGDIQTGQNLWPNHS